MRPDWDAYFLMIAEAVATRADCRRRQYGSVIVKDHRIVSTGYNGSPAGAAGCLSGACPRGMLSYSEIQAYTDYENGPGRCISIHAEANAIMYADYDRLQGASIYITGAPCSACSKLIAGAGITRRVWPGTIQYWETRDGRQHVEEWNLGVPQVA